MNAWTRALLIFSTLGLVGCPYSGPSPVAEESTQPLDARLVGDWHCASPTSDDALSLRFSAVSAAAIDLGEAAPDKPAAFRLHSATLADTPVLNIEDRDPDEKDKWSLGRITFLRPNVIDIELARGEPFDSAPEGTKPTDTARKALAQGELFADSHVCVRAEGKMR